MLARGLLWGVGILEGLAHPGREPARGVGLLVAGTVSDISEHTDWISEMSKSDASLPRRLLDLLPALLPARLPGLLGVLLVSKKDKITINLKVRMEDFGTPKNSSLHKLNFRRLPGKRTDAVSHTKEKEMQGQMLTQSLFITSLSYQKCIILAAFIDFLDMHCTFTQQPEPLFPLPFSQLLIGGKKSEETSIWSLHAFMFSKYRHLGDANEHPNI